jgi:hypothetical protein
MRIKTDFYRMRLLCGSKEVEPIQPAKAAERVDVHNPFVNVTDATYVGIYTYQPDAISPACRKVSVELYSEKSSEKPTFKVLNDKTVERVWSDFAPYRDAKADNRPQSTH